MAEEKYFLRKTSDDKWVIKEEMVTTKAEKWADEFIGRAPRKPELKCAQLRKFYNEVRALADMVEVEGFEKVSHCLQILIASPVSSTKDLTQFFPLPDIS